MFKAVFLAVITVCYSTLIGEYRLWDSRGSELYDFSESGNHAIVNSYDGPSYTITDRGYYLRSTNSIDFPNNKYKANPGNTEVILAFWHKPVKSGTLMTFKLKSGTLFTIIKFNWIFYDNTIKAEYYKDNLFLTSVLISGFPDDWRFSVFHLKQVSDNTIIYYYRRLYSSPDIGYTVQYVTINSSDVSWSICSESGGAEHYIYDIYWYDSLETTVSDKFSGVVSEDSSRSPCLYKPSTLSKCITDEVDPYISSEGIRCDSSCINNDQSCSGASDTCISYPCDSSCITGCYNINNPTCVCPGGCNLCTINVDNTKVCDQCGRGYSIYQPSYEFTCVAECPLEYYEDNTATSICKPCEQFCNKCIDELQCNECILGYYLKNQECVSSCGLGYYQSEIPNICEICLMDCDICSYSDTVMICKKCNNSTFLKNTECVIDCSIGFFQNVDTRECESCSENCERCDNLGMSLSLSLSCLDCNMSTFLKNEVCVSSCGVGYFEDISKNQCDQCSPNCEGCSYYGYDLRCDSCDSSTYLKEGVCVNSCGTYYFQNKIKRNCEICSDNCEDCSYVGDNLMCDYCNSMTYLKNRVCENYCGMGYYQNTSTRECDNCTDHNCAVCESNLICSYCNSSTYLKGELCVNSCGIGYFQNESTRYCESCSINCEICDDTMICTGCDSITYLKEGSCVSSCGIGYYQNESTKKCQSCFSDCEVCNSVLECSDCNNHTFLKYGICVVDCGIEYFGEIHTRTCERCSINCKICSSASWCSDCDYTTYLKDGSCLSDCGIGYFGNPLTGQCESCSSNCEICSSAMVCSDCNNSTFLKDQACVYSCGLGYFDNEGTGQCEECSKDCLRCSYMDASLMCNECDSITYLKEGVCVSSCGIGYYQNESIRQCQSCSTNCEVCSYKDTNLMCNLCLSGTYFKAEKCLTDCGIGFYSDTDTRQCVECSTNCNSCSYLGSSLLCTDCNETTYLNYGICVSTCEVRYYQNDDTRKCDKCSSYCNTCSYSYSALKCFNCDTNFSLKNGECEFSCGSGYFSENRVCYKCSIANCLECESREVCNQCSDGSFLIDQGEIRSCSLCSEGSYEVNGQCVKCPVFCLKCKSSSMCTECVEDIILTDGKCICNGESVCTISPSVSTTSNSQIQIEFNILLTFTLNTSHISITLNEQVLPQDSYSIIESQPYNQYILTILSIDPQQKYQITLILNQTFKEAILDYDIYPDTFNLQITPEETQQPDQEEIYIVTSQADYLAKDATAVLINSKAATSSKGATSCSVPIGSFAPAGLWSYLNTIQILTILPMINIELPLPLFALLSGSREYNPLPNLLEYMFPMEGPLPIYRAVLLGYKTSQFLYNIGSILSTFLLFIVAYPFLLILRQITILAKPGGSIHKLVTKSIVNYKWNIFIRLFIQTYLDIGLAAVFQLQAFDNFSSQTSKLINLVFGLFFLVLVVLFPIILAIFIYKNHHKSGLEEFNMKWGTIFEELKDKVGLWVKFYYVFYLVGRLILIFCFCFLSNYPKSQGTIVCLVWWLNLIYLLKLRPFKDMKVNVLHIIENLITAICYSLIMAFFTDLGSLGRDIVQYVIIGLIVVNLIIHLGFMVYNLIIKIIYRCRGNKSIRSIQSTQNEESDTTVQQATFRSEVTFNKYYNIRMKELVEV